MMLKEKVLAYILRETPSGTELLVFDHADFPEAGTQIPAGTVDPGEGIEAALLREIQEESGICFDKPGIFLGKFKWYRADKNEWQNRNVFQFKAPENLPEEWLFQVKGTGDDKDLRFQYFWLPIQLAQQKLAAEQGIYLEFCKR